MATSSRTATRPRSAAAAARRERTVFEMLSSPTRINAPPDSGPPVLAGTQGMSRPLVSRAARS